MATWPAYAKILRDGFGEEPETALLQTEMDDGPPKVRRVKSRVMVRRSVTVQLASRSDYLAFKAWFSDAAGANKGSAWFDWFDPVSSSTRPAKISGGLISGKPLADVHGAWRLQLTLESWDA